MNPVLIVSPDYPPRKGGVADHTTFLAAEYAKDHEVIVLTSEGAAAGRGYEVWPTIRDWHDQVGLLAAIGRVPADTQVVWQYVPHMYGRGGVNATVPAVMRELRMLGRRLTVIAHEICMPWSAWPHRFHYAWAHRRQWRVIAVAADRIGVSTEAWIDRWSARWPWLAPKMVLSPSPSNIPVVGCPPDHARAWRLQQGLPEAALVMTFFGTLSAAKQFEWVETAWRAAGSLGRPVALVVLGGKPVLAGTAVGGGLFKPLGHVSAEEVSRALQATDLLLLPFVDGVSERRTTFSAGMSHGLAIVTTAGPSTGRSLRQESAFVATGAGDREAFERSVAELARDGARRAELGSAARRTYLQNYDWPVVISRLRSSPQGAERSLTT